MRSSLHRGTVLSPHITRTEQDTRYIRAGADLATDILTGAAPFAHRGNYATAPEDTLEALRIAYQQGARSAKIDVVSLADGTLGVMHDPTVDRTTSSTGAANTYSSMAWKQLTIPASTNFAPGWTSTVRPPLLEEVLNEFGGKMTLMIEPKTITTAITPLIATVARRSLQRSVMLTSEISADNSWVATAAAAGVQSMLYWNIASVATYTPAAAISAGASCLGIGINYSDSDITSVVSAAHAAGLKVVTFSINRRWELARSQTFGIDVALSNDSYYVQGTTALTTAGGLSSGLPSNGLVHSQTPTGGGTIVLPTWLGSAGAYRLSAPASFASCGYLIGHLSPLPVTHSGAVTITYDAVDADTTRYAFISLQQDDYSYNGTNYSTAYVAILRESGQIALFRVAGGTITNGVRAAGTATGIGTPSGTTAITAGTSVPCTWSKTPTGFTFTRTDNGNSVTATDSTYAGPWYLHVGKTGTALAASFSALSRTA